MYPKDMKAATGAYAGTDLETTVASASPHKLVSLLFAGAVTATMRARALMAQGDVPGKGSEISRAINIIDNGLRVSVDQEAGGEIATNLIALYEYMSFRLLHANLKNDLDALDEVTRLLNELKGAWDAIGQTAVAPAPAAPAPQQRAAVSYGKV